MELKAVRTLLARATFMIKIILDGIERISGYDDKLAKFYEEIILDGIER